MKENFQPSEQKTPEFFNAIRERIKDKRGKYLSMLLLVGVLGGVASSAHPQDKDKLDKDGINLYQSPDSTAEARDKLSTWKSVTVGDYGEKNTSEFIKNLFTNVIAHNIDVEMIRKMKLAGQEKSVDIVLLTPADLGLSKGSTYKDLEDALKKHNLEDVDPEAFLQLFLENDLKDVDGKNAEIVAGMKGIKYVNKELNVTNYRVHIPGTGGQGPNGMGLSKIEKEVEMVDAGEENRIFSASITADKIPVVFTKDAPKKLDLINLNQVMTFQKKSLDSKK